MPDYPGLLRFLLAPLLENPQSLIIHQEVTAGGKKVWLRVTFQDSQKGRVFGRGGRTIQAIRQVLLTAAAIAGQSLRLDIGEAPIPKSPAPVSKNPKPIRKAKPRLRESK
ncbi:MAG: KH domain-containing protein [Thermostichales cyanobacterium BF4_bins_65]